jgi:hypothetical protein
MVLGGALCGACDNLHHHRDNVMTSRMQLPEYAGNDSPDCELFT